MNDALAVSLLRQMYRIRLFEEKVDLLFKRGMLGGTVHLCIGQEATSVGVCAVLDEQDVCCGTHRGHGHAIAKGVPLVGMFAELMGKRAGCCKGKGGTQHLASLRHGFLGTNGITGGGVPIATGAAFALAYRGLPNVSVAFFGDGAVNQGIFHESLNFASIWDLPIAYICENNLYAMSTHVDRMLGAEGIIERARAYRIEGVRVDGMDVLAVYDAATAAVAHIRTQRRPYFIECLNYRYLGHSRSDARKYRTVDEEQAWQARDPIERLVRWLTDGGLCTPKDVADICKEVEREIDAALNAAIESEEADPSELFTGVYA